MNFGENQRETFTFQRIDQILISEPTEEHHKIYCGSWNQRIMTDPASAMGTAHHRIIMWVVHMTNFSKPHFFQSISVRAFFF